jgi:tRNA(fMet)-specific endonuclease VapC
MYLAFDDRAAGEYGIIRADLERAGKPIGPNDLLIAALARSLDLTLVSLNQRELDRIAGLRLTDFADPV